MFLLAAPSPVAIPWLFPHTAQLPNAARTWFQFHPTLSLLHAHAAAPHTFSKRHWNLILWGIVASLGSRASRVIELTIIMIMKIIIISTTSGCFHEKNPKDTLAYKGLLLVYHFSNHCIFDQIPSLSSVMCLRFFWVTNLLVYPNPGSCALNPIYLKSNPSLLNMYKHGKCNTGLEWIAAIWRLEIMGTAKYWLCP